jgi:hypothetical protein
MAEMIREGWAWGLQQRTTNYGMTLAMVTELCASRDEVAARSYGTVAYVRAITDDSFIGGRVFKVVG